MNRTGLYGFAFLAALIAACLAGCGGSPAAATASPPPAVTVAHPLQKEVVEWDIYTGHLEAPESVNVAARVSGLVIATPFVEGAIIKKGDVLFVIDDRPFRADLDAKVADQKKAQAQQAIAKLTLDRLLGLQKDKAVSEQDVDNARANLDQADATVAAAMAAVDITKLNLEWCKVLSPIDGRVSNKMVTVGNLVNGGAGQATLLTTIQSVTPIYCYVDVDEQSVLKYQRLAAEKKRISARDARIPCYVQLGDETGFPHEGYVDFVDNHVDPTTGTLRARSVLDNESGRLTPGYFARLCIPGSGRYQALLIPDAAIGNDQNERTVFVVTKADGVEARVVQLGALFGKLRSITSGLKPEDRVIINGQMHARPGVKVAPVDGAIQIDAAAFSDPGSAVAPKIPATDASAPAATMNSAPALMSSTQTAAGTTP